MSQWEFLELGKNGQVIPLKSGFTMGEAENALNIATRSKVPNPKFSNYYVKCACVVVSKQYGSFDVVEKVFKVSGGNLEYGLCQALHGEESLVSAVSSKMETSKIDPNKYRVLVAFSSKTDKAKVPGCCGNCRDILRDYFPPKDTLIFSGNPNGGEVILAHLSDLLVDEYEKTDLLSIDQNRPLSRKVESQIITAIVSGKRIENDIYFPGKPNSRRRYYASIVNGFNYFSGAHDVMCDYHPIYALRDAIRQARRANKPSFDYVVVACQDDGSGLPPDVMYKDRQHLLELNFQQECLSGGQVDPVVYLAAYQDVNSGQNINLTRLWRTTVKGWLPYPFSPAAFGDEFVRYATKRFREK